MTHHDRMLEPDLAVLTPQEKREYLSVLCDVLWDIEAELAQIRAQRAALMNSLQGEVRPRAFG
jgi:hypothetical protein